MASRITHHVVVFAAVLLPSAVIAQSNALMPTVASERAEHGQWERDVAKWEQEHAKVAQGLTELAVQLRSSEDRLAKYDRVIETHAALLKSDAVESGNVLARHAAMRSAHEDMRRTHARLLEAYGALRRAIDQDDDKGARK